MNPESLREADKLVQDSMAAIREGAKQKPNKMQDGEAATIALMSAPTRPQPGLWDFPLTDYGNGERLVLLFGGDLRYCHPWKSWLVWDGRRWVLDATAEVIRRAKATVRRMWATAGKIEDSDRRDKALKYARYSEKQAGINAMIALASSEPGIPVLPEQLDTDPLLLNLRNGTYDLQKCELREHRREDLITKICPVDYDPAAKAENWVAFQYRVTGGNQELIEFKQRLIGYSLSGAVREKRALFIYHGKSNAGKTTEIELLRDLMGDYGGQIGIESLMEQRGRDGSAPSPDVASLRGKRLVISSEPAEGRRLAESKIKYLTGMGTIQARHLHKENFEFPQTWKFFMDCNHKPVIRGTDNAIWNRIALVPWEVEIPENEIDKSLPEKLRAELPGILAWAIQGWSLYHGHNGTCSGLNGTEVVSRATSEYRSDMDDMGRFISERCVVGEYSSVRAKNLYESYRNWCQECGEEPMTMMAFGIRMPELGFQKKHDDKGVKYEGIGIRSNAD